MNFYDEKQNPMKIREMLSESGVFLIAEIPNDQGCNWVGLFVEDDENYFLKVKFDIAWLDNLRVVASRSHYRKRLS